jgi:hypothetical protein
MICEYCERQHASKTETLNKDILAYSDQHDSCVYILDGVLNVSNAYTHTEEIEINFCPMCGRKLGEEK